MKKIKLLILVLYLLANQSYAQVAADYFPVHQGNYWIFNEEPVGGSTWSSRTSYWEMEVSDMIMGEEYFAQERREIAEDGSFNNVSAVFWLREGPFGNIIIGAMCDTLCLDSATIYDPPGYFFYSNFLTLGYEWGYTIEGITINYSVESVSETVVTPAGTFTNCIKHRKIRSDSNGVVLRDGAEYFAEGVGVVKGERTFPEIAAHESLLAEYLVYLSVDNNDDVGVSFSLDQNYPNPFNTETIISYKIPNSGFVNISIYNVSGQLIETLVNEYKDANSYVVNWNALHHNPGVYFYQIVSSDIVANRKCLIVR